MNSAAHARVAAVLGLAGLLGGCVGGLLGGGKPDRLYSFGGISDVAVSAEVQPRRLLSVPSVQMPAAVAGDRILTVQGNERAYIKDVRWVSPAAMLMQGAIEGALRTRVPDMTLADTVTVRKSQAVLSVRLSRFEAEYATDADSPPKVRIVGDATLIEATTRRIIARLPIDERETARGNGSAELAAAFDRATQRAVVLVVDAVNQRLPVPAVTTKNE
jgi:cholesterol transport system auxiliary component